MLIVFPSENNIDRLPICLPFLASDVILLILILFNPDIPVILGICHCFGLEGRSSNQKLPFKLMYAHVMLKNLERFVLAVTLSSPSLIHIAEWTPWTSGTPFRHFKKG